MLVPHKSGSIWEKGVGGQWRTAEGWMKLQEQKKESPRRKQALAASEFHGTVSFCLSSASLVILGGDFGCNNFSLSSHFVRSWHSMVADNFFRLTH